MRHALAAGMFVLWACSCAGAGEGGDGAETQAANQTEANKPAADPNASRRDAKPPTVSYYGGRVITNAKVYLVFWGTGDGLKPEVTRPVAGIGDFYAGILDSAYMDGLRAFDTDVTVQSGPKKGSHGTGQHIGRGNYAGAYAMPVVPAGDVTDEQISATVESSIASGALPAPDENTIYAIYFPAPVKVKMQRMTSCIEYRAYHYVTPADQHHASYIVIPDCGDNYTMLTRVSSHELVEAVTDVVAPRNGKVDATQSWARAEGTESSDYCTGAEQLVSTKLGKFAVQGWNDGVSQDCIIGHPLDADFAVSTSSSESTTLSSTSTKTLTFDTSTVSGEPQTLTLSVSAPSGVTATLSTDTVTAGSPFTVKVKASSGTVLHDAQVVVTATGSATNALTRSASHLVQTQ